jgi:hypothetical protein
MQRLSAADAAVSDRRYGPRSAASSRSATAPTLPFDSAEVNHARSSHDDVAPDRVLPGEDA